MTRNTPYRYAATLAEQNARAAWLMPKLDAAPLVKFVLACGEDNAKAVALAIASNRLPDLYLFACDCRLAWRGSGLVEQRRYQPWAVTLEGSPGAFSVKSISRLVGFDRRSNRREDNANDSVQVG